MTFNCKNIRTCVPFFTDIGNIVDIVLVQEHWLFNCQLYELNEIHDDFIGTGKAVDSCNPLPPIQMPRGYGGVGILWRKTLDHIVKVIPLGGERIQCVELIVGPKPILVMSVYMPCKGHCENVVEFIDCIEQVHAIVQEFCATHLILIGGDINEDISLVPESRRKTIFKKFLSDNDLMYSDIGKNIYECQNGRSFND